MDEEENFQKQPVSAEETSQEKGGNKMRKLVYGLLVVAVIAVMAACAPVVNERLEEPSEESSFVLDPNWTGGTTELFGVSVEYRIGEPYVFMPDNPNSETSSFHIDYFTAESGEPAMVVHISADKYQGWSLEGFSHEGASGPDALVANIVAAIVQFDFVERYGGVNERTISLWREFRDAYAVVYERENNTYQSIGFGGATDGVHAVPDFRQLLEDFYSQNPV